MFLENEGWELCPVKANFTALNLHEFRSLRQTATINPSAGKSATNGGGQGFVLPSGASPSRAGGVGRAAAALGFFTKYGAQGSPFDKEVEVEDAEDVIATNGVRMMRNIVRGGGGMVCYFPLHK